MMHTPPRRTAALRKGRIGQAGATYFTTACTHDRNQLFHSPNTAGIAVEVLLRLVHDEDVAFLAGNVMPDHIHVLFELGNRLSLDRVHAKLKGLISRRIGGGIGQWQENVFEHRLRADEAAEDFAFYIFMNPYREGLISMADRWPYWVCTAQHRFRFLGAVEDGRPPPPEWLAKATKVGERLERELGVGKRGESSSR